MMWNVEPEGAPPQRRHRHLRRLSNIESFPYSNMPHPMAQPGQTNPHSHNPTNIIMPQFDGPSLQSSHAQLVSGGSFAPLPKALPLQRSSGHHRHHSQEAMNGQPQIRPATPHTSHPSRLVKRSHSRPELRPPTPHIPHPTLVKHSQSQPHAPYTHSHPFHPEFRYSKCSGKKKAVCIGINYTGQRNSLRGCINDARRVAESLMGHCGFKSDNIILLTDESRHARQVPTRANMLDSMRWLVQDAKPHDSLFFHYSGHGGQTPDQDGDETDGLDEVIFPIDYQKNGTILDDEMHQIMVKPLPAGCRLTAIFDSCHSGTVLDLPFVYTASGRLRGSQVSRRARTRKATPADVISWSACRDDQTSVDTFVDGRAVGAMSNAFMTSLRTNPNQSYYQLLRSIRHLLYKDFSQKPQLGSSHHIDTNLRFVI